MKNVSNFLLMLKQGIKGVFKFKAQFIIIIILAFVATFILSVSLSTERRINKSYTDIVKPIDEFSYQGNQQINSGVDGTTDAYVLPVSLNNAGSTQISNYDSNKTLVSKNSKYNFIFNDEAYKDDASINSKSFITKGVNDFAEYLNNSDDSNKALFYYDQNAQVWYTDSAFTNKLNDFYFQELMNELQQISDAATGKINFTNLNTATIYSSIGQYTYNNPYWMSKFWNQDSKTLINNVKSNDKEIFNTTRIAVGELAGFSHMAIDHYLKAQSNFNSYNFADAFSFLFGKKIKNNSSALKNEWILTPTNAYSLNITNQNGQQKKDFNYINNFSKADQQSSSNWKINAIANAGFKGISNPFMDASDNESLNDFSTFDAAQFLPYNLNGDLSNMQTKMSAYNDFYNKSDLNSGQINGVIVNLAFNGLPMTMETVYLANQKMAAEASGFDFNIRREITFFDSSAQIKYRGIVLDPNENYNFTLLRGYAPAQGQNITISEQFAKKNHLKVGDSIKAGDAFYNISGIATDAFSFVPSQDMMNPIPNPKVSSFVYANAGVLKAMEDGTRTSAGSEDSVTQDYSYFLWNKEDKNSQEMRRNVFSAVLFDKQSSATDNFAAIKSYVDGGRQQINGTINSNLGLTEFKKSSFRYSWTLEPLVFKAYSAITYTAAGIIALIAIISLVICVKKTIDFNSKQIGILKAMGEEPVSIAISYLSYSIIITFIVIPVAWILGMLLQIPFGNMFLTYFSAQPQVVLWDWISLVISLGAIGLLSGIIAFVSAYVLTNKPVTKVLSSSVKWGHLWILDWMKRTIFKKARFNTRFSLTLTSSGSRQIVLMTIVMFIASLLITLSLAIPSIAMTVNNSYYKSVKYANKYEDSQFTQNAPLSKNALSFWEGHDYLDSQYVNAGLKLDNTTNRYGYYKDPEAYTSTISGANVLSPYLYDGSKGQVSATYSYALDNYAKILDIVGAMFGSNFYSDTGEAFSIGMIDKLYGVLLHSLDNPLQSTDASKLVLSDNDKFGDAQGLSQSLTDSFPQIISAIVNSNSSGGLGGGNSDSSMTWKENILSVIYKVIPSYVKAYVKQSDSRMDQYAIAYANDIYMPGKETLTTNVSGQVKVKDNDKSISVTGLDKYQNAISIDKQYVNNAYLPNDIKQKVYDILNPAVDSSGQVKLPNEDIVYGKQKIYDASTNTLNIPVIPNKQAESSYSLKMGNEVQNWSTDTQRIQFNNGSNKFFDLPKQAWVYDDTDYDNYINSDANKTSDKTKLDIDYGQSYDNEKPNNYWAHDTAGGHTYLDPYSLDNNKFTYYSEFNEQKSSDKNTVSTPTSLADRAQMFMDWKKDDSGLPTGNYLRPYYQYKNLKMMVPKALVPNADNFLWNDGTSRTSDGNKTSDWYNTENNSSIIPQSVKDGYLKLAKQYNWTPDQIKQIQTGDYIIVNPYDISYYQDDIYNLQKSPLGNLLNGPNYWYANVLKGTTPALKMVVEPNSYNGVNINLKSVGSIDSYSDKLVVMDQDIANELIGYSNAKQYQYNYQVFDTSEDSTVKAGTAYKDANGNTTVSQFDRWKFLDTTDKDFLSSDKLQDSALWKPKSYSLDSSVANYAPHLWYNGKLSNDQEATPLTTQISFAPDIRWGQFSIGGVGSITGSPASIVKSSTLLSESKALINQIATLAIAIGAMLVIAIIITASLLTMLTGDIYIAQYKRFMVLMRALGYSKSKVFSYTFGTVSIMAIIAWVLGTILAWGIVFIGVNAMWTHGFAIPAGITWWPIVASFLIMLISYAGSLYVSSGKARKENPSVLLTATAE